MSTDAGQVTAETVIFATCELFALAFAFDAVERWRGGEAWPQVIVSVSVALALILLGFFLPSLIKRIRAVPLLTTVVLGIAALIAWRWTWIKAVDVLAIYGGLTLVVTVVRMRGDLDRHVMPRIVTTQQANAIQKNVRGSGVVTVKVNPLDRESMEYANQLVNAIRQTNWNVDLVTADAPLDNTNDGLNSHVTGHNNPPEQYKYNPGGELQVLVDGLQKSGIQLNGGSGQGAGEYKMFLIVGRRPFSIGGPPFRFKVVNWINRMAMRLPR